MAKERMLVNGKWQMVEPLLDRMRKNASLYEVSVFPHGGIDEDYNLTKKYKTYKGAVAYAIKQSSLYPEEGRVEVIDLSTDRERYGEDISRTQEYINGTLWRDGEHII